MFVNLTPHSITIVGTVGNNTIPPSGMVARCASSSTPAGMHEGIALARTTYGQVEGLPPPQENTIYIVSALVRTALGERTDLASPGDLVRDSTGAVIGCRNLIIN